MNILRRIIVLIPFSLLLFGCCEETTEENAQVHWRTLLTTNDLIGDEGLGFPSTNNTVLYHSTPPKKNGVYQSIIHGLDIHTGKEKWRLTNEDFYPKKKLRFSNQFYCYHHENIFVGSDFVYDVEEERYLYGIDMERGKVMWVRRLPEGEKQMARIVRGIGKTAYMDCLDLQTRTLAVYQINIETGEYSKAFEVTNDDLPEAVTSNGAYIDHCHFSDVYTKGGEHFLACSINLSNKGWHMALYVYNLSKKELAYTVPVECRNLEKRSFYGRIYYYEGRLVVGKDVEILCYDAFEDKGILWQQTTGTISADYVMQVLAHGNVAMCYTMTRLLGYDLNTGKQLYSLDGGGDSASMIDGIAYQREDSDITMRDPNTGKILTRVATPMNEEAFTIARPSGANGRIFATSFTHAYCIKAWNAE